MREYGHGGDIYGNPGVTLDFSVNTNPLGMPDIVHAELVSRVGEFARYPDPFCRELRNAIAATEGVAAEDILCGNGAADLIYRMCYALKPRNALVCAPTFSEYERALRQVGCAVTHYTLSPENGFVLTDGILEKMVSGVDLVFLCHPNNPTGRLIPRELIGRIAQTARRNSVRVVVDECFLDFTDGASFKEFLRETPELLILKAFTKTYALAGLRLGYLLSSDAELLDAVNGASQCWSVSVPAQIAGVAALSCTDWLDETRKLVKTERQFLSENLSLPGLTVFPSDANFLMLRSEVPLYGPLLRKGILIRSCENFPGLDATYYRAGIKTRPDNLILINAIKEILRHG